MTSKIIEADVGTAILGRLPGVGPFCAGYHNLHFDLGCTSYVVGIDSSFAYQLGESAAEPEKVSILDELLSPEKLNKMKERCTELKLSDEGDLFELTYRIRDFVAGRQLLDK